MRQRFSVIVVGVISLAGLAALAGPAAAHEVRPALLEITETEPGWFEVAWKVPIFQGQPLKVAPVLPASLKVVGPPARRKILGALIETASYRDSGEGLVGQVIVIEGLSALQIDVLVQIALADGTRHSAILRPGSPSFTVPERARGWEVAGAYWRMGTIHILEGIDHLLFVLALMLIVTGYWALFKTITAFTVSHSISLGLATLGFVNVPQRPTEAVIALSILFLASEIVHVRQGRPSLTARYPWIVAFIFGLFHGLGFAGALSEVGLPQQSIPLALLMFNLGVETGQLLFVAAVIGLLALLRRLHLDWAEMARRAAPYAIGGMAAYWTIERLVASFAVSS